MATSLRSSYWTPVVRGNICPTRARGQSSAARGDNCLTALRLGDRQLHVTTSRCAMTYLTGAAGGSHRRAARLFSTAARALRSSDPGAPRLRPTFAPMRKHSPGDKSQPLNNVSNSIGDESSQETTSEDPLKVAGLIDRRLENGLQEESRGQSALARSQQGVEIAGNGRPPVADVLARMKTVLNKTKGRGFEAASRRQVHSSGQSTQAQHSTGEKVLPQLAASRHSHLAPLAAELVIKSFPFDEALPEGSQPRFPMSQERPIEDGQSRFPQEHKKPSEVQTLAGAAVKDLPRFPPLKAVPLTARPDINASRPNPEEPSETRRKLPPLKLRSRGLVRKVSEPATVQAESGTALGDRAYSHQDQRSSSTLGATAADYSGNTLQLSTPERRGLGESVSELNTSVSGQTNGKRLFEPQLREGHVETGGPLTEWLRSAAPAEPLKEREADLQPLVVPGPEPVTRGAEDLASELGERLSLGVASRPAVPLTEWAVTMPGSEDGSVTVPGPENASETRAGQRMGVESTSRGSSDTRGRRGHNGAEAADVTRESTEAAPLTEWLTQARDERASPGLDDALVSRSSAKLTDWREQAGAGRGLAASSPVLNGRNQRPNVGNLPPKPVLRPGPIVRNGREFPPRVLDPSSSTESEQAGAASVVEESVLNTTNVSTSNQESDADAQRTPEWHALRRWRLTASAFGNAAGCWPDGRLRLWEEKLELRPAFRGNAATAWGTKREAPAIDEYLRITGNSVAHQSFQIYKEHDEVYTWLGASPDGLIERDSAGLGQGSGVLEVKCPFGRGRPETAQPYGSVPFYYIPQVQGLLEIFDREWADVHVWTVNGSVVYRVERDPAYWALLFSVLSQFWWQHVIPAKHEMLQGRMDPAYLRQFEPQAADVRTGLILEESKRLSGNSPAIWTDSGRVLNGKM